MSYAHVHPGIDLRITPWLNDVAKIAQANSGYYEKFEIDFVLSILKSGDTFLDIGANVGFFSIAVAKLCPNVKTYAFEPAIIAFEELKHNIEANKVQGIISIQKAVGSSCGLAYITMGFHASNYLTTSESKLPKAPVEGLTIDHFVEQEKIPAIRLVKIDVEGLELSVLRGAINTIRKFRPTLLVEIIENHPGFYDRRHEPADEILKLVDSLGYQSEVICENSLGRKSQCKMSYHNYIFKPR